MATTPTQEAGPFVERIAAWRRLWIEPETPQALSAADVAEKAAIPLRTAYRWIAEWQQVGLIRPVAGGRYVVGDAVADDCDRIAEQWKGLADAARAKV